MNFRTSRLILTTAVLFVATAVGLPNASFGEDESSTDNEISGTGPRSFDPVACLTADGAKMSMGYVAHCLIPEKHDGPASGIPGNSDFQRDPSEEYAAMFGEAEPAPLPVPDKCTTPARGSWTHDSALITEIVQRKGKIVVRAIVPVIFISGLQEGRSTAPLELWLSDDKTHVIAIGRELFEGTIDGRKGSMLVWNVGRIDADGRGNGRAYAYEGAEGLKNVRFEAGWTVMGWKGGHWTDPSRVCFVD